MLALTKFVWFSSGLRLPCLQEIYIKKRERTERSHVMLNLL